MFTEAQHTGPTNFIDFISYVIAWLYCNNSVQWN